jgi:hypothetical protein
MPSVWCLSNLPYSSKPAQSVSAKAACYFAGSVLYTILAIWDLVSWLVTRDDNVSGDDDNEDNLSNFMTYWTLAGSAALCYIMSSVFVIRTLLLQKNEVDRIQQKNFFFESFIGLGAILEFAALLDVDGTQGTSLYMGASHIYFIVAYNINCRSENKLVGQMGYGFFFVGSTIDLILGYVRVYFDVSIIYSMIGSLLSSCLWLANATLEIITERYLDHDLADGNGSNISTLSMPLLLNCNWEDLPPEIQVAARKLGYTPRKWDSNKEPTIFFQDWQDLAKEIQEAALSIGYTQETWDSNDDPNYSKLTWRNLPPDVQTAVTILGFTPKLWNNNSRSEQTILPPISGDKTWNELSTEMQEAAQVLGFTIETWNRTDDKGWSTNNFNLSWREDIVDQYDGEPIPFQLILPSPKKSPTAVRKRNARILEV